MKIETVLHDNVDDWFVREFDFEGKPYSFVCLFYICIRTKIRVERYQKLKPTQNKTT